jgi:hypothetical protein
LHSHTHLRAHHSIPHTPLHTPHTTHSPPPRIYLYNSRWMPFYIPVGLIRPSSLLGHHVHSSYIFEIECDIPGATDLSVKLPVRISFLFLPLPFPSLHLFVSFLYIFSNFFNLDYILAPQFLWSTTPQQPTNAPLPPTVLIRPPWQADEQANSCNLYVKEKRKKEKRERKKEKRKKKREKK